MVKLVLVSKSKERVEAARAASRRKGFACTVVNDDESTSEAIVEPKAMDTGKVVIDAAALQSGIASQGHIAVYGIHFATGKAELQPESEAVLAEIALLLQKDAALKLHVIGHTDNQGALANNMDLSKRRAAAVVAALTKSHGVSPARLLADGIGSLSPVATNRSDEGRALNRRVELVEQ